MKKLKNIVRYYIAGSLTGVICGIVSIALGLSVNDWQLTTGGWILLFLGIFICGPGLVVWYWDKIIEKQH